MGPACMLQERWAEKGAELVCAPSSPKKPDVEPDASEAAGGAKRYLPFGTGPRQCATVHISSHSNAGPLFFIQTGPLLLNQSPQAQSLSSCNL